MKCVIINSTTKSISTGQILIGLYDWLVVKGIDTYFFYGRHDDEKNKKDKRISRFCSRLSVMMHMLMSRLTGLQGYFSYFTTKRLIAKIKKIKPDFIVLGILHGYYINFITLFKFLKKHKINTYYFLFDEYPFLGKCAFFNNCMKFKSECSRCPAVHDFPSSWFFDRSKKIFLDKKQAYSNFSELTFVGFPYTISCAKKSAVLTDFSGNFCDFGWGLSLINSKHSNSEIFKKYNIPDNKTIILNVGRYSNERKGIKKYFYPIAQKLADRSDIVFVHIGLDKTNVDIPKNVIALPFVNDQELLLSFYSFADLLVITSDNEGLPTVCVEALACGTPICGFKISGIPYVAPSPFGEYIEPFNVEKMVDFISRVEKKNKKTINECKEYAISNYSREVVFHKIFNSYIRK